MKMKTKTVRQCNALNNCFCILTYIASDPFETHISSPNETETAKRVKEITSGKWRSIKSSLPETFRLIYNIPDGEDGGWSMPSAVKNTRSLKVRLLFKYYDTILTISSSRRGWYQQLRSVYQASRGYLKILPLWSLITATFSLVTDRRPTQHRCETF